MFKYGFNLIIAIFIISSAFAQLETRSFNWDNTDRDYLEYIPTDYTGTNPVPVVFGLHGLGDNMNNFYNVGMNFIADTAGFILIIPQAETFSAYGQTSTAWNSGASSYGITPNEDVDDTGFLMAILDSLENNYNIDTESVYFFGFSMGGYMCNRLAAEVPDRINAIASVSGTIGINFTPEPSDQHYVACLHFHGTADETVQYTGNTSGMDADELVEFWRNHNGNDETPVFYEYPDNQSDGLTFERYVYPNGQAQVAHIKVIGGDHAWYYHPVNDIDYGKEIWKFLHYRFSEDLSSITDSKTDLISFYPNPVKDKLTIKNLNETQSKVSLYNTLGTEIDKKVINKNGTFDLSKLSKGIYYLQVSNNNEIKTYPIIKQ
ncbi:MAG: alpha/beta fold hydrolase [Bacteroidota bacterium]|nr:alpha/beta fold hydrolase [Bacteroidota bacterium]